MTIKSRKQQKKKYIMYIPHERLSLKKSMGMAEYEYEYEYK